jgi:hypothetical protein
MCKAIEFAYWLLILAHFIKKKKPFKSQLGNTGRRQMCMLEWLLVALLEHIEVFVITPTLRTICNIITGNGVQSDSVLTARTCALLVKLLSTFKDENHQRGCVDCIQHWIPVGNFVQIQALVTNK